MFERLITNPCDDAPTDGALRTLDWQELVGRLAAARDMRALFTPALVHGGSFTSMAAEGVARECESQRGVNLGSLTRGKWDDATAAAAAMRAAHGDRDKR